MLDKTKASQLPEWLPPPFSIDTNPSYSVYHRLIDQSNSRIQRILSLARAQLYNKNPREIEFSFLDSDEFNAVACVSSREASKPFDFIGINIGVLPAIFDRFLRILSHPSTFPDIGNPQLEKIDETEPTSCPPLEEKDIIVPLCPVRLNFACELAQVSIEFLAFHELTHLRHGHLDFLEEKYSRFLFLKRIPIATNSIEIDTFMHWK